MKNLRVKVAFSELTVKSCCQFMGCSYENDWVNIILAMIYSLMFFTAYKGQVHVFAGRMKIVSHLSCRTSAILK